MSVNLNQTSQHILEIGYELILSKGFTAVGLAELLKTANVPKGSFYHYFKSKEHFGETLIEHYFETYMTQLERQLFESNETAYQRLVGYFEQWLEIELGRCNAHKCLVVKLGAEVSDLSDSMRTALLSGTKRITSSIEHCIEIGIEEGSIRQQDAKQSSDILYQQWLGASLYSKLCHETTPLLLALTATKTMLKSG